MAVAAEPKIVGNRLSYYDSTTYEELGWYDAGTKTAAYKQTQGGPFLPLGKRLGLSAGSAAVIEALSTISVEIPPTPSANDSLYPDDVDPLVDAALNIYEINAAGKVTVNGIISADGPALFLWYHSGTVSYLGTDGHWKSYASGVWGDVGLSKPGSFTPAADWFTVPDDGAALIDDDGATWSLGSAAGSGFNGQRNFHDYNSMWCTKIKIGDASHVDGNGKRIVYHLNPGGLGWIYEVSPGVWVNPPIADPESGTGGTGGDGIVSTTGSISSGVGMNKVTVATVSAAMTNLFNAGKLYIAVATGGEATFNGRAGGQRGTVGPGGCWPSGTAASGSGGRYANTTAMNAALGNWTTGDHVWVEDTGQVYFHNGSGWQNKNTIGGEDITRMAQPRALCAKVTAINGNVLTVNQTAVVQTTNANVFVDIAVLVQEAVNAAANGTNSDDGSGNLAATTGLGEPFNEAHITRTVIDIDAIIVANVGSLVEMAWCGLVVVFGKRYITLKSTSGIRVFHPTGCPGQAIEFRGCKGCRWQGRIDGNFNPATDQHMSWGGTTGNNNFNNGGAQNIISGFQEGSNQVYFYQCTGCVSVDARGSNVLSAPTGGYVSLSCRVYRHRYDQGPPSTTYTWHSQFQVSDDCHFIDCQVLSDHLIGGAEHFVSGGTYPNHHIRWSGRNFLIAVNDGGNRFWIGEDPNNPGLGGHVVEFTAGCLTQPENYPGWTYINQFNPAIHVSAAQSSTNVNLGGVCPNDYVGRVANVRITVSGLGNARGDCTGGFRTSTPNRDILALNFKYFGQNFVSTCLYGGSNGCECNGLRATFGNWEVRGLSRKAATNRNMFANNSPINLGNIVCDDGAPVFV